MSAERLILFRYRDLLSPDTLGAHRRIIDEKGDCWWGWWRRPSEDVREDVWDWLQKKIEQETSVQIAFFNSAPEEDTGGGLVHFATLTELIKPKEKLLAPSVPEGEQDRVPKYYRETPFSSAWMRLSAIRTEPVIGFFKEYAYRCSPESKGIAPRTLKRFADKLVVDADELRSMDTTIWELRTAKKDDLDEKIVLASAQVSKPLSDQPIPLESPYILHLSDLHFSPSETKGGHRWNLIGEGSSTLAAGIKSGLGDVEIGLVIISGDITNRAAKSEFYEAFRFIHALLGAYGLGPEHLLMIPGNHDIAWTETKEWKDGEKITQAPDEATEEYRSFYRRVFRHNEDPKLSMARRYVCANGLILEVGGLNSSALESGKHWLSGMGRVADRAIAEVKNALGWTENQSLALRLLVHHHHMTATESVLPADEYSRGFGIAHDAKQTLREAASCGVQLILHGHRHQPYLGVQRVYPELESGVAESALGEVGIVGAGSAGSNGVRNNWNFFNLIEIKSSELVLSMYGAQSQANKRGDFKRKGRWGATLEIRDGSLEISEWWKPKPEPTL